MGDVRFGRYEALPPKKIWRRCRLAAACHSRFYVTCKVAARPLVRSFVHLFITITRSGTELRWLIWALEKLKNKTFLGSGLLTADLFKNKLGSHSSYHHWLLYKIYLLRRWKGNLTVANRSCDRLISGAQLLQSSTIEEPHYVSWNILNCCTKRPAIGEISWRSSKISHSIGLIRFLLLVRSNNAPLWLQTTHGGPAGWRQSVGL